jgi:hypothetical protein
LEARRLGITSRWRRRASNFDWSNVANRAMHADDGVVLERRTLRLKSVRVGRDSSPDVNDIVVPDEFAVVSRSHCSITPGARGG